MIEDIFNNNGHNYIDLELPSGTVWSTRNIGASKPTDFGLCLQWGDTQGYTRNQMGTGNGKKAFTWKDYKWDPSGDGRTFTKYTNPGDVLEPEDNAAYINMGGDWHIPSPKQIKELTNNTINAWTTLDDGVSGRIFISKKDMTKSIFIPIYDNDVYGALL